MPLERKIVEKQEKWEEYIEWLQDCVENMTFHSSLVLFK